MLLQHMDRAMSPVELGRMRKVPCGFPDNNFSAAARLHSFNFQVLESACAVKSRSFLSSSSPIKALRCWSVLPQDFSQL